MALIQPIINYVDNFDASEAYKLNFYYLGPRKASSNQVSIREAVPQSTPVYEQTQSKLNNEHTIPANALKNGKKYWIKVRVLSGENTWSVWSEEAEFICITTPTLTFETIDPHGLVFNDDLMMTVSYFQPEGEMVKTYQFTLYDEHKQTIESYPTRFPSTDSPSRFSERMDGLVKGSTYYIGVRIKTVTGLELNIVKPFVPQYQVPTIDGVVQVTNESEHGQVLVETYMKQVLGMQVKPYVPNSKDDNDDNYTYLNNDWVVIPPSMPLIFKKLGMGAAKDFTLKLWCKNVDNGIFIDMAQDKSAGTHLQLYKYNDYITCEKEYNGIKSRVRSNVITGLGNSPFYMYVNVVAYRISIYIEKIAG